MSLIVSTSSNQSNGSIGLSAINQTEAFQIGEVARDLFERARDWIGSLMPSPPFAYAQQIQASNDDCFLQNLEVNLRLVKIVPSDRRYLQKVKQTIDDYVQKNKNDLLPPKAIELLSKLTEHQAIDLEHGVPLFHELQTLTENCFYHQVNDAVLSANRANTQEEAEMSVRVIDALMEEYLSSNKVELPARHVLEKFSRITDKLGCLQHKIHVQGITRHGPCSVKD